jgi:hypothetical protein
MRRRKQCFGQHERIEAAAVVAAADEAAEEAAAAARRLAAFDEARIATGPAAPIRSPFHRHQAPPIHINDSSSSSNSNRK